MSADLDPSQPNVARIYDYLLGGKDHYEADREAAEQLLAAAPETYIAVRENRAFLGRAVRHLARAGIKQFLDLGTGLPTQANVHEVAREVIPDARVVYVDHDPVVVAHGQALLGSAQDVTVIRGDVRSIEEILAHDQVKQLLNFDEPIAVLMLAVLHFVSDEADPASIVRQLHEAMAPGSALVLSHVTSEDNRPEAADTAKTVYDRSSAAINLRTRAEIAAFFDGFELLDPGLVYAPQWRPNPQVSQLLQPEESFIFAGVARRP